MIYTIEYVVIHTYIDINVSEKRLNDSVLYIIIPLFMTTCVREVYLKGRDKQFNPIDTEGCNYLSLALIPASGTRDLLIHASELI